VGIGAVDVRVLGADAMHERGVDFRERSPPRAPSDALPQPVVHACQQHVGEIGVAAVPAQPGQDLQLLAERPGNDIHHGHPLGPPKEKQGEEVRLREIPGGHDYKKEKDIAQKLWQLLASILARDPRVWPPPS
jgi:hypothetical protein